MFSRSFRLLKCSSVITPLKLFLLRAKDVRSLRAPISEARIPLKLLLLRSKEVRLVREPISEGTLPLRRLLERSSAVKHVKYHSHSKGVLWKICPKSEF
jgi:hypothetical protein